MDQEIYSSPGILDISKFKVDANIAAWALEYLMGNGPNDLRVERHGNEERYIGIGGRAVILDVGIQMGPKSPPRLSMFRRFEYKILARHRGQEIDAFETFKKFRERAQEIANGN